MSVCIKMWMWMWIALGPPQIQFIFASIARALSSSSWSSFKEAVFKNKKFRLLLFFCLGEITFIYSFYNSTKQLHKVRPPFFVVCHHSFFFYQIKITDSSLKPLNFLTNEKRIFLLVIIIEETDVSCCCRWQQLICIPIPTRLLLFKRDWGGKRFNFLEALKSKTRACKFKA